MCKIIGRIVYFGSMIVGACITWFGEDTIGLGMSVLFIGSFIGMIIQAAGDSSSYSSYSYSEPEEEKPYYKDEFEEYQHYKFVKKHMK